MQWNNVKHRVGNKLTLYICDTEEPAVHGEYQKVHYGQNAGYVKGDVLEKRSQKQAIKGLECSEEFGLINRIYKLCSLTSHVLVT